MRVVAATKKPTKRELTDDENDAVQAELKRLKDEPDFGTWRSVGKALGFPPNTDQQTISRAAQVRAGREVADALYRYLHTNREQFLRSRGIAALAEPAPALTATSVRVHDVLARVAAALGFTDDEVELASSMVRGLAGTSDVSEELARELLERARSNRRDVSRMFTVVSDQGTTAEDELGGGASRRNLPTRRR